MGLYQRSNRLHLRQVIEPIHSIINSFAQSFNVGLLLGLFFLLTACEVSNPLVLPTDTPLSPTSTAVPTATPPPDPDTAQGFGVFLTQAESLKLQQRQDLVSRYTAQLAKAPITSDGQAVFLWRGAAHSVAVVGDMNGWDPAEALMLTRLEGTDLWYLIADYEPEARLDYQFVIDGDEWKLDPLNPQMINTRSGPNSVLTMAAYVTSPELRPAEQEIPKGTITSHTIDSSHLSQTRTFFVYEPAGQLIGRKLPTIYINNGSDYLDLIDAPAILDNLIAQRIVPPLIAVFIPPISAPQDYTLNDDYVGFLADELVPFIQQSYDVDPDPAVTGVLGSALGGLAAVHTAFSRPDVFGLAAGQSGIYSANGNALIRLISRRRSSVANGLPTRYYLVAGIYETAVNGEAGAGNVLAANRRLVEALETVDQVYQYDERPEGHSWGLWQGTLGRALAFLYGRAE